MPEMKSVYSSHLDAVGYDSDTGELHVKYKSGGSGGAYYGVPADIAAQVIGAASVGRELHRLVIGLYEFRYHGDPKHG